MRIEIQKLNFRNSIRFFFLFSYRNSDAMETLLPSGASGGAFPAEEVNTTGTEALLPLPMCLLKEHYSINNKV